MGKHGDVFSYFHQGQNVTLQLEPGYQTGGAA